MFEGFETLRIDVGEVTIACVTAGDGDPVLLLHGFPQTHALWARIAPALVARGYRVICADLRGYGDSTKPAASADLSNYSFRAIGADQTRLMSALGHDRFHLVGHDRGARTAQRMALDHPDRVASLTVMDIVPTDAFLTDLRMEAARTYWHWFFLAQPAPFPERLIGAEPDYFFESCLFGAGAARIEDFQAEQLAAYRAAWRDPGMIAGACNDYRATLTVDLLHDLADADRQITTPTLVLYGAGGAIARLYDLPRLWAERCVSLEVAAMAGGHFFPDSAPHAVAARLDGFLAWNPL